LFGVEIDGDWAGAKASTQFLPNTPGVNVNVTSRFNALATARTRAGVVLDSLLLYVTGGVAGGQFRTTWTNAVFAPPPGFLVQADISEWRWGWVAGFGTEWAWSDRVSIRSEVLYVDVADRDYTATFAGPAAFGSFRFTNSDSMWISRVGINWKFGKDAIVAKY
jgi:outer membrane immunogenic protein